uniref:Methionine aminopeptidase n=1 Tax=Palpitomonas bilix TaxID=652834 RepID=A0A7S3D4C4_9EUKA|mmetsp:Transcript_2137/g.4381  ORF Transcript_2137/g.4381 Transcript_2137/m.4381 type:complete len:365 (+) Transcript_2137:37-1131(+)
MVICDTEGCEKEAKLQCPTCRKLGLDPSFFCSQECFKSSWTVHKAKHQMSVLSAMQAPRDPFAGFKYTGPLRAGKVSPMRTVKEGIEKPDYWEDGVPHSEMEARKNMKIQIRTKEEMKKMRRVCKLAREVLDEGAKAIKPGVTTDEIDRICHEAAEERGCYPSPLNYRNFPKSCCTSVNEIICHGIPDDRELREGDVCKLDVTVYKEGFHGDLCEAYAVGEISQEARELCQCAYDCLNAGIKIVRPGNLFRDIGGQVQNVATSRGYSVVRSYCGHGIGNLFHTAPNVPHYAKNKAAGVMKPGMCFTIEPMINAGKWQDVTWPDNWSAATIDGSLSAQFEHTMAVTENGVEVLTARLPDSRADFK